MDTFVVALEFVAALLLVAWGGERLTRYGEALGDRWGLGTIWVGLFLLATITSLPEVATGLSAVVLADAPNIAVGALLGSCVFNLLILVIVDFVLDRESIFARLSRNHLLSAGFGVILIGVVGANVVLEHVGGAPSLGWIGIYTPGIALIYVYALRSLHRWERENVDAEFADRADNKSHDGHAMLAARFGIAAVAVFVSGVWLPFVGERIALVLGVGETFVGTLFVAFATSLPEITVAVAAVRIGAPNMAVGNLLGSNIFNVAILVPADLLFTRGPILAHVDATHALSAVSALTMTGVVMVALLLRPQNQRFARFGGVGVVLVAIYLLNSYFLYRYG